MVCGALIYSFIYFPFSCTFNIIMQDAEKLRGLTIDMHALMEDNYVANCQHFQICQPFSNHHDFLLVVVGWHLLGCTWVTAKALLSCINGDRECSECKCRGSMQ